MLSNLRQTVTSQGEEMKDVRVKFVCGADLLESFAVPDLWDPKDVRTQLTHAHMYVHTEAELDCYSQ